MTQYFSVYVYVKFQIRGDIAKLYFFTALQQMYEKTHTGENNEDAFLHESSKTIKCLVSALRPGQDRNIWPKKTDSNPDASVSLN